MRKRITVLMTGALVAASVSLAGGGSSVAASACDPMQTTPSYRGEIPTGEEVLGFPIGSQEVTSDESDEYLAAVDASSPRVVTGTLGTSVQGRPLDYAIVGSPGNVTPDALARISADMQSLRNPKTSAAKAAGIVKKSPTILWVASNVHGGEESGTDASLRVLYDLADRDDCAASQILKNAIVVLLPVQNPDGREADTRRNAYGFDMNRDWFARTQPETDGTIEFLRKYPGVLFIDAHEMGRETYFFPPNADPIYHEITDESIRWINDVYGAAMAAEFDRQGIPYFNRDVYDLFYMGYGDTVPSTGFISAGMTFEKSGGDPISQRTYEQYVTQWVSLSQGAVRRGELLSQWRSAWVKAYEQGVAGELEPNEIINPGNDLVTEVPDDPVRHYFIRSDDPAKAREVQALIRRLQRMDVSVYRLTDPLAVPDFKAYGRTPQATVLPAGTYWIPMAQYQKHWVQSMLNEDTYTPFPYFYDVTGWSNPLLFNVAGGTSGDALGPQAVKVSLLPQPSWPSPPADVPNIALYQISTTSSSSIESSGWLRHLLEQVWDIPYREVTAVDIAAGALSDVDVLLVPNGSATTAFNGLGQSGRDALVTWVNGGGRYIGWRGGAALAARLGITTATLAPPTSDVPGSLFRVAMDQSSPLSTGVGPYAWAFYEYDNLMTASDPSHVAVAFPTYGTEDFFVSGFADGEEELSDTAAVVDEPVGSGRAVIFSIEPNFRALTDGTQKILRNAILGSDPVAALAPRIGARTRADEESAARRAALALSDLQSPIRLSVRPDSAGLARGLLDRFDARYEVKRAAGKVLFLIENPRELTLEEHPFLVDLAVDLRASDAHVVAFTTP